MTRILSTCAVALFISTAAMSIAAYGNGPGEGKALSIDFQNLPIQQGQTKIEDNGVFEVSSGKAVLGISAEKLENSAIRGRHLTFDKATTGDKAVLVLTAETSRISMDFHQANPNKDSGATIVCVYADGLKQSWGLFEAVAGNIGCAARPNSVRITSIEFELPANRTSLLSIDNISAFK